MSRNSSIDIIFSDATLKHESIFDALLDTGWSPIFDDQIYFLPLGDEDSFDWKSEKPEHLPIVRNEINEKFNLSEIVGIVLVESLSSTGGEFLFFSNQSKPFLSITLSVNRRTISEDLKITDITWYLKALSPLLNDARYRIESIAWKEHV